MPQSINKLTQLWQELRRRKVIPILIAYVAACFAIIEFVLNASETFSVPEKTIRFLYLLSAIGIPVVILISWYINRKKREISPDVSSRKSESSPVQEKFKKLMERVKYEWENFEV